MLFAKTVNIVGGLATAAALALCGCSEAPPVPPQAPPQPIPAVVMQGPPATQPDDWNLFPDPTTGEVEVYHKGNLVGAVTGKEPENEDPPVPHPTDSTRNHEQDPSTAIP